MIFFVMVKIILFFFFMFLWFGSYWFIILGVILFYVYYEESILSFYYVLGIKNIVINKSKVFFVMWESNFWRFRILGVFINYIDILVLF